MAPRNEPCGTPQMRWTQDDLRTQSHKRPNVGPTMNAREGMTRSIVVKSELYELYYYLQLYELLT